MRDTACMMRGRSRRKTATQEPGTSALESNRRRGNHETTSVEPYDFGDDASGVGAGLGQGEVGEVSAALRMGDGEARWAVCRCVCCISGVEGQASGGADYS